MPKRTDIKSVMVIGSGPIVIGQAAEFDYSGTQACRVLREEGIRVILVNSNPATIMTDPEMADATYIEPIATPILEQIIAKERPDALLPTLGGQTALNAAMALGEAGVLKKYNVELIGASLDAIDRGEDRELFKKVVDEAGAESARSEVAHSMKEVDAVAAELGYPLVVRPSFTMGGLGSGIAHDEEELHRIAGAGLSDLQIAHLRNLGDEGENTIRELRWTYGLRPVYKTVDTCAAEFDAVTPYYYSCYADETELRKRDREAVIILGSGPNRIGQGIEFDYTCVHAVQELGKDYDTIMVNCNPETVSTDYDMSNRLYFEPLTFEDVLEIYEAEKKMGPVKGVIVQLGGQTPLSLAARLKAAGVPILGTTPESIDLAENRELFGEVLRREHMNAPRYGTALSLEEAREAAHNIGYPVLVRPSYVLGGRGMEIVYDDAQLTKYVNRALDEAKADTVVSGRLPSPLLIDKFLQDAIEIDVDALFDGEELYIGGIMEHIEEAGVHSGDAACTLPPSTLSDDQIRRLREGTYAISKGCGVKGLINVQYAFMANTLYVIEANPRASRTVPFASKATGVALAKAAALHQAGPKNDETPDKGDL